MSVRLRNLGKQHPDFAKAFSKLVEESEKEGALSTKTKELISVALGVVQHCPMCIAFHVKNALQAGATPEKIMEAAFVAVLMGDGPALAYMSYVIEACEEFASK